MVHYKEVSLNNPLIIVCGVETVYEEKINKALNVFGPPESRVLIDKDPIRLANANGIMSRKITADVLDSSLLVGENLSGSVAIIAIAEHLGAIRNLSSKGITWLIVEKPLVNNVRELNELEKIQLDCPDLKIYPLDFYIQKTLPLLMLTGVIKPDDLRWQWVVTKNGQHAPPDLYNSLPRLIGNIEGIEVTIVEGGKYGLEDLNKRPWLENDNQRGGVGLDLGTHALYPLTTALFTAQDVVAVNIADRYVLGQGDRRRSNHRASDKQAEMHLNAELAVRLGGQVVPLLIHLGKTFLDGGMWQMTIKGEKGMLFMGLRTRQSMVIVPNQTDPIHLMLKPDTNPYQLAFQEAKLFFDGKITSSYHAMADAIRIIDRIKAKSNEQ